MIEKYRTKLNDFFREGDPPLLMADVNFRRIGAVAGVVAPYVGVYLLADYSSRDIPESYMKNLNTFVTFLSSGAIATLIGLPFLTGFFGHKVGKALDNLVEKIPSKIRRKK